MCSVWSSSLRMLVPQWRHNHNNLRYLIIFPLSKKNLSFVISPISSSSSSADNSPSSKPPQLGYDPSEDLFGLAADLQPRNVASAASKRSWFGPNGLYIRELPCPSCRGRGYTPCEECGIERPRSDCSLCNGKGTVTCNQCNGDCVIWEESIDERPWEKARSVSPLKVKEDDEVDNLDIKLDGMRRKTKRVYQSSAAEVNLKISRSLKVSQPKCDEIFLIFNQCTDDEFNLFCLVVCLQSLNARTGIFSKRMKLIHKDPVLHAQRVAAIKKTKGTDAAKKQASESMKIYFSDPENRRKRSISMKGIKFHCRNCGGEGHRSNYCPETRTKVVDRRFKCRLCGEKGHNRRTCLKSKSNVEERQIKALRNHRCKICGQSGHNRRTCPKPAEVKSNVDVS